MNDVRRRSPLPGSSPLNCRARGAVDARDHSLILRTAAVELQPSANWDPALHGVGSLNTPPGPPPSSVCILCIPLKVVRNMCAYVWA